MPCLNCYYTVGGLFIMQRPRLMLSPQQARSVFARAAWIINSVFTFWKITHENHRMQTRAWVIIKVSISGETAQQLVTVAPEPLFMPGVFVPCCNSPPRCFFAKTLGACRESEPRGGRCGHASSRMLAIRHPGSSWDFTAIQTV